MMKTNLLRTALCLVSTAAAFGAPLTQTTAVHTKPDASSPAITYLKAGSEPTPATAELTNTPAGWMAVELSGPVQGYVLGRDLTKQLNVKPGTPILQAPKADAPVLTTAEPSDKTTITGIHGRWTQISLNRNLVGYIQVASTAAAAPATSASPVEPAAPLTAPSPAIPAAAPAPATYGSTGAGQPNPGIGLGDSTSNLPRQFTGKFVSTRSMFRPRRPYDWELDDNAGRRYAYVDVSKLLLTDQIEKYAGHFVVVFGAARPIEGGREIVIQVESLQLLMR